MPIAWPYIAAVGGGVALSHLILLLILLFRQRQERSRKISLAYLGVALLWGIAVTLADLQAVFLPIVTDTADMLIPVFATGMTVALAALFCAYMELPILSILATAGGTWGGILFVAALVLRFHPLPAIPFLEVTLGGWCLLSLLLIVLAIVGWRRSHLALTRNRVLYWLMAFIPLLGGQAASLQPIGPLRGLGPVLHLIGAVPLVHGVLSMWLPNVKASLRSILRFLLLAGVTAAFLTGIVWGAETLNERLPRSVPRVTLVWVLASVVALVYLPLYRLLERLVNRLMRGVGFDPAQALRDYSQTIGTLLDLEQLATVAIGTAAEVLGIRQGALLVATETERGGLLLQPVPGLGDVPGESLELEPISPVLSRLREQTGPLFQYEVEHHPVLREAATREREWLRALGMEIFLPIRSQDGLIGLLAFGPQKGGEPYEPPAVEFMMTMANQTAVALQNARLFEGLQALNARITRLNETLRTAYERLEKMDRAKTDFLTIASHELRTPLTQVRGYVDVLRDLAESGTLSNEQVQRISANIDRPARRLENIINAMLDASRIETEGLDLHFVPTSLSLTMRLAIEPWSAALEERNIILTTEGLESIPAIQADIERLCQAFSNLISNAIKFTPDGGRIIIRAQPLDDDHFEVTITDTGIGISRADLDLIFEKFYRAGSISLHSSGEYKFKGAGPGLGLPIARGVIEGHGGCIWAESEGYDERRCPGSTFHVVLPYRAHRGPCRWQRPSTG